MLACGEHIGLAYIDAGSVKQESRGFSHVSFKRKDNYMIRVKNIESKVTPAKQNITISNVTINEKNFTDEEGFIMDRLIEKLPYGEDTKFTIKIAIELSDTESDSSEE